MKKLTLAIGFAITILSLSVFAAKNKEGTETLYQIPTQGKLISKNNRVGDFYFKREEGYFILASDVDFNDVIAMMNRANNLEYYGAGLELKIKTRLENDDEWIMRVGEEESWLYVQSGGEPKKKGESNKSFFQRSGKSRFKSMAEGSYGNSSKTKPRQSYYHDVISEAVVIASDGIFKFDIIKL